MHVRSLRRRANAPVGRGSRSHASAALCEATVVAAVAAECGVDVLELSCTELAAMAGGTFPPPNARVRARAHKSCHMLVHVRGGGTEVSLASAKRRMSMLMGRISRAVRDDRYRMGGGTCVLGARRFRVVAG